MDNVLLVLSDAAYRIANVPIYPGRITDWADQVYRALNNRNGSILVEDINALQLWLNCRDLEPKFDVSISHIDQMLARRGV